MICLANNFLGNGGWGDKRDQLMCLNMSTYNSTLLHEQLGESFGLQLLNWNHEVNMYQMTNSYLSFAFVI